MTASGSNYESDRILSAIDGASLAQILANSEGITDKEAIMHALDQCCYRHVASCNIIYGDEMAAEIKRVMPEKFMHILTANNEGHGLLA